LPKEKEALMLWETVFEGTLFKVDRWQRLLISIPEQGEYIKYLINKPGISKVKGLDFLMSPPKKDLKNL